ncbi:scale keratin-like [Alligator sinensis]|uniref:Scale keratin-like n=1 Tax=Alligator sinensis TaxID=38654 RepID=A0A1U7SX61_ALLSI|nr:scale keratin-like [Alligator sinensis]
MSCTDLCYPSGGIACPKPYADSCNEACVRQCLDSRVVIRRPPAVVTFRGPILSNFPQDSIVGSAGVPAAGHGAAGGTALSNSIGGAGGFYGYGASLDSGGLYGYGGSLGYGGLYGYGGSLGYGGLCGYGGLSSDSGSCYSSGYCSPYSYRRYGRYRYGSCGPC